MGCCKHLLILAVKKRTRCSNVAGAPLSSFSSKVELAFALGTVSKDVRVALHLIADVRDEFARQIEPLSFDSANVAKLIDAHAPHRIRHERGASPRDKFLMTVHALAALLHGMLSAQMRVESLEQTHAQHFFRLMIEAIKAAGESPR
jgi:hypothetical protein